ncbi:MAG: hypothetical protein E7500_00390 [Ruminococcus sp.]|nr:hypothetical protein [Ruminococcus sp.]
MGRIVGITYAKAIEPDAKEQENKKIPEAQGEVEVPEENNVQEPEKPARKARKKVETEKDE